MKGRTYFIVFIISVLLAFFVYEIFIYCFNFPYRDEFRVLAGLVHPAFELKIKPVLHFIFFKKGLHIPAVYKSVYLTSWLVLGGVHFKWLAILANVLFLSGIAYRLKQIFKMNWITLLVFVPILVNFRYYELSLWSLVSIQILGLIYFTFSAFYFANSSKLRSQYFSMIFSILALFSIGNGILVPILSFCLFVLNFKGESKRKIKMIWIVALLLLLVFYVAIKMYSGISDGFGTTLGSIFSFDTLSFYFSFLGSFLHPLSGHTFILTIGGSIVFLIALLLITSSIRRREYTLPVILIFIFGTALMAALYRAELSDIRASFSRYAIYSLLLVFVILASFLRKIKGVGQLAILVIGVFYFAITYQVYKPLMDYKRSINTFNATVIAKNADLGLLGVPSQKSELFKDIVKTSVEKGIYRLPSSKYKVKDLKKLRQEIRDSKPETKK